MEIFGAASTGGIRSTSLDSIRRYNSNDRAPSPGRKKVICRVADHRAVHVGGLLSDRVNFELETSI